MVSFMTATLSPRTTHDEPHDNVSWSSWPTLRNSLLKTLISLLRVYILCVVAAMCGSSAYKRVVTLSPGLLPLLPYIHLHHTCPPYTTGTLAQSLTKNTSGAHRKLFKFSMDIISLIMAASVAKVVIKTALSQILTLLKL